MIKLENEMIELVLWNSVTENASLHSRVGYRVHWLTLEKLASAIRNHIIRAMVEKTGKGGFAPMSPWPQAHRCFFECE
jgi:hypothetical protein